MMKNVIFILISVSFVSWSIDANGCDKFNKARKEGISLLNQHQFFAAYQKLYEAREVDCATPKDIEKLKPSIQYARYQVRKRMNENRYEKTKAIENARKAKELQKRADKLLEIANYHRNEAEQAKENLKKQIALLEEAKQKLEIERNKVALRTSEADTLRGIAIKAIETNQKLADAIYFYDDKYALAFKNERFYFIDKLGNPAINSEKYTYAEQFDNFGLAKVRKLDYKKNYYYAIDTNGNEFRLATNLKELKEIGNLQAIHLSIGSWKEIPKKIYDKRNIEVLSIVGLGYTEDKKEVSKFIKKAKAKFIDLDYLRLRNLGITKIPKEIGKMYRVNYLDLRDNNITKLPKSIFNMKNLKFLDVRGNKFKFKEVKNIEKQAASKNIVLLIDKDF